MANTSRRALFFAGAIVGGLGLLIVMLWLFTQPPQRIKPTPRVTPTPWIVAMVDDESIFFEEWQQAVATDLAMSALVGQPPPNPEETLDQLTNQRLVLRAASRAGLPEADQAQAEVWLASFLMSQGLEETTLEETLAQVGLTRANLTGEIVPRLLRVQQALNELAPGGDSEAWIADLRRQAKVVLLENLSASVAPNFPMPTPLPASTASEALTIPAPSTASSVTRLRAGEFAPDFSLKTTSGATVRMSDQRGQPVLLNFWAPWCGPCREELPMLQDARDDGLIVLGIAVRESPDKVMAFATELGLELPLLLDQNGQTSDAYQVRGLPTSLFVDPEGVIVARHVGPLDQATLDGYLSSQLDIPLVSTPAP